MQCFSIAFCNPLRCCRKITQRDNKSCVIIVTVSRSFPPNKADARRLRVRVLVSIGQLTTCWGAFETVREEFGFFGVLIQKGGLMDRALSLERAMG